MLNKFALLGMVILGTCSSAMGQTVRAPAGWDESTLGASRIFSNGVATVRIDPWLDLRGQSLESWLQSMENQAPGKSTLISSAGVKPETVPGAYSVIRKVDFGNSRGHSVLYACPGENGHARLMTLNVTDANFKDTLVGAMFGERVCKKEPFVATTTVEQAEVPPIAAQAEAGPGRTITATAIPATGPAGLKELRGVITLGIQPGGMFGTTEEYIAVFDDGSYTEDLVNTFGSSVAASKRKRPGDWGHWRVRGSEIQLREHGDTAFEDTRGNWLIEPSPANFRLSGCFGRLNSSSGADYTSGTTVGLAQTWCFWKDGRFTNSRTAFGSSSNASMRASSTKARGRYQIDGYVAQFVYDDGQEVTAAFGYASTKGNHLMLNGKRFMGAKR